MKSPNRSFYPILLALAGCSVLIFLLSREPQRPIASVTPGSGAVGVQATLTAQNPSAAPVTPVVTQLAAPTSAPLISLGSSSFQVSTDPVSNGRTFTAAEPTVLSLRTIVAGDRFSFPLPDRGFVEAKINASLQDSDRPSLWTIGGEIGKEEGSLYLAQDSESGMLSGVVMFRDKREAWVYNRTGAGGLTVVERLASEIVCTGEDGLPPLGFGGSAASATASAAAPNSGGGGVVALNTGTGNTVPNCSSRPTATSVLYIDFDPGSVTQTFWNCGRTITYISAGMTANQMVSIWSQVSENFAPFDVNVTTNRTTYTNATVGRRMRFVMPKTTWSGKDAGFAAIGSFPNAGGYWSERSRLINNIGLDLHKTTYNGSGTLPANCGVIPIAYPSDIVCWGFADQFLTTTGTVQQQTNACARVVSHELGHTFGLLHESLVLTATTYQEYYPGHGSGVDRWSSMMGYQFNPIAHWSKGEYSLALNRGWGVNLSGANLFQDDLAIIGAGVTGGAGNGLLADDKGNTIATAALLTIDGLGAVNDKGLITSETDTDFFRIPIVSGSGVISLSIGPKAEDPNLDVYVELQNSSGTVLASSNISGSRSATIGPITVAAGNYYLKVEGSAEGTASTGWTRYGNLGNYGINGSVTGSGGAPVITASSLPPDGSVGISYSFPLAATNNPTSYYLVSGVSPPGLLLSGNSLNGIPTTQGWYNFTLAAANGQGASSKFFTMYVFGPSTLDEALDAYPIVWTSTSPPSSLPASLWQGQRAISHDGNDAARSGSIGANSESILTTDLKGPGKLTFYWRTSSHTSDRLIFRLNTTEQFNIGGETAWEQKTVLITGSGTYPVSWIYRTDPGTTAGQDAGFVDQVTYLQNPDFPAGNFYAGGTVGQAFYWPIVLANTNVPNTWTLTGGALPPGITLDPNTGVLNGTPTTLGTYDPQITATNAAGSSTTYPTIYIYPDISLATALDAPGLTWITGGTNPWFGDNVEKNDGVDAAHSGPIRHGLSTFLQTSVTGPGTFSFWWKASTDLNSDLVYFSIDGVIQTSISGEVAWVQRSQALSAGPHTLRWEFIRDGSGNGGQNMAWVDQVNWTTPGPTITSPLTVNMTCGQTITVPLTSDDPAAVWSVTGTVPADMFFLDTSKIIGAVPKLPRTVTFTLNATNAGGTTTSRVFTAIIESSYAKWARDKGLAVGTELGDPDKDGIVNIAELAFGLEPLVRNNGFQPVTYDVSTKKLKAVFKRRHQFFPDLKYEVQVSTDLKNWTSIAYIDNGATFTTTGAPPPSISEVEVLPYPDSVYQSTVIDGVAQSPTMPRRVMRLKITQM